VQIRAPAPVDPQVLQRAEDSDRNIPQRKQVFVYAHAATAGQGISRE
jgi:hypothetical protein